MGRKKATPKAPLEEKPTENDQHSQENNTQDESREQTSTVVSSNPQIHRVPVKVNHYNLKDLKFACDDYVAKYLSRPNSFQQQHTHTDIRLGLGYSGVIIGGASVFYGWKTGFEQSKPVVTIGVALYFFLTFLQTLYIWFVEKETIFVGKRKTLDKRIFTERLNVSSKTINSTSTSPPKYSLDITYLHSANGGKTIINRGRESGQKEYNSLFDSEGYLSLDALEQWVEQLVSKAVSS